jgi:hypothetical protein
VSILSDLLAGIAGTYSDAWRAMGPNPDTLWVAAPFALAAGPGLLRVAWRHVRTAMRPLPRPGVVLIEDFLKPGDTSWMPDLCDCSAELGATPEKHRSISWKSSMRGGPLDAEIAPCPRWRPKPQPVISDQSLFALHAHASETLKVAQERSQSRMCDCTGAPHTEEADCPDAKARIPHHIQMAMEAARLSRFASASGERRALPLDAGPMMAAPGVTLQEAYVAMAATGGVAVMRPEASVVIRSPMPPSRPEYRRPAPTPIPGGGRKHHA